MFDMIKRFFGSDQSRVPTLPADFYEAGSAYLGLVKSRILESVVTPDRLLLPRTASPQDRFQAVVFLTSYFAVRTDMEMKGRGIPQALRDEAWRNLIDAVFNEMDGASSKSALLKHFSVSQMELVKGILEKNGVANAQALADSLVVLLTSAAIVSGEPSTVSDLGGTNDVVKSNLHVLLGAYESYLPYLDDMRIAYERQTMGGGYSL